MIDPELDGDRLIVKNAPLARRKLGIGDGTSGVGPPGPQGPAGNPGTNGTNGTDGHSITVYEQAGEPLSAVTGDVWIIP